MQGFYRGEEGFEVRGWSDSKGRTWDIKVDTSVINGRQEPVAMYIKSTTEDTPLLQSTLRELPFAAFLKNWEEFPHEFSQKSSGIVGAMSMSEPQRGRGSRRLTESELMKVAEIYEDAYTNHLPVQATVALTLGIPISTACKRINAARRLGFLPKATRPGRLRSGSEPEGT